MNTTRTTAFKVGLAWIAMLLGAHQAFAQLPSVTLRVTDAVASEPGTDTATFCVSRTGSLDAPLTVFYGVGGTASNGVDYVTLPNNVNIPAGASNATVVVQPVDDSIAESPETIILTLTTNAAYALASPSSATATLLDNDNLPPTVAIVSPDNLAVITGPTNIVVTAQVSDADGWIRNVNFYNNGVYIGSSGYANSSNPASAGSVTTCSVLMTNVISGHFTLSASAYDNLNLMVTSTPVNVTVTQDLSVAVVKVVATDYRASEPGADTGVFTVSRIGNINQDISVFYTVGGTAASGSDYTSLPGSVRIPAGATNATILIQPIDDTIVEPAETVILTLSLDPAYVLGDGRTATVYIYDNETNTPPAVTLTSPANGSSFLDPTNILLTADAADIDGAVTRVDFYANGVSVGYKTNAPFSAMWYGMPMGSYTLTAKATDNMGATTTSQPVVVTIARTPLVNVSVLDSTGSEPGTDTATILVSRSNNTNSDLAVNYTVAGTATPGVDYVALSGSVTIPAGVASVSIVIQPIDDTIQEPTETVTVNLSTNSTYMLGSYRSATVYILDNETNQPPVVAITSPLAGASFTDPSGILVTAGASDPDGSVTRVDFYANGMLIGYKTSTPYTVTWYSMPMGSYALTARATDNFGMVTTSQPVNVTVVRSPVVYLTVLDGYASEPGSDTATIQVNRSNNTNMDLVVNYTVSGTATPGVDYESLPGSVTIPAGVSSVPIAIRPIDDTLQELTETVIVTLSSNASSSIGSPGSACVYIRDDETNTPPAVELTAPTNGASFSDPSTIVLTASATDAEGAVTRVDFYVNGALLSYKTNAPFTASWYGMPQGVYTLTAKATDNLGAATTSQPVSVMVNRTPVVSLSVPDGSASEPGSDTATIQVNRSNNTNTALVVNYTVSGTATSGVDYEALPGSVTIPAGASSVPIVIRPIDDTLLEPTETVIVTLSSNSPYMLADLRSACVYILDNETNQPPAIVLTTPTNGASFYDPTNILMAADATDVDGVVTRVDFFVNNLLIATDTNAPFTAVWGGMMQGIYTLTARATDNLGAATVSPPVTVNVIRTPSLRITALDAYAGETAFDTYTVQVYRYYNTNLDILVNYTIGGTASNGVDHVTLPGSVIIPAGQCSANIVIQPIDDTLVEPT